VFQLLQPNYDIMMQQQQQQLQQEQQQGQKANKTT
jgi:hypothetical protein